MQAFLADRQIGRDANGRLVVPLALMNREAGCAVDFGRLDVDGRDRCGRGSLRLQSVDKNRKHGLGRLGMNRDAVLAIEHPAGNAVLLRQSIDERTKAHALYHAAHVN